MQSGIFQGLAVIAAVMGADALMAQESTNRVAEHRDWSVFQEEIPTKHCWSVSRPKESEHKRNGRLVEVQRGDILLHISFIPEKNVNGQVSFVSGYPFREGWVVKMSIDGKEFELFTLGEMAWPNSDEDDRKLVEALKLGKEAVVVGLSSRGTTTTDTFSLLGVTAAIEDARERCSG